MLAAIAQKLDELAQQARDRAMVELAKVISGQDPADDQDQLRGAVTVA
jgi:hypothetical protein